MRLTINIPANVPVEVINAALRDIGGTVSAPVKRSAGKRSKIDAEFPPVMVYRDGEVVREIDGISAQKAIRKIMAGVNRRGDLHWPVDFKRLAKHVPDEYVAADYMNNFCAAKHHKPATYTNGVTA